MENLQTQQYYVLAMDVIDDDEEITEDERLRNSELVGNRTWTASEYYDETEEEIEDDIREQIQNETGWLIDYLEIAPCVFH